MYSLNFNKNCNLLIPRPLWRISKLKAKIPTLREERPALKNIPNISSKILEKIYSLRLNKVMQM